MQKRINKQTNDCIMLSTELEITFCVLGCFTPSGEIQMSLLQPPPTSTSSPSFLLFLLACLAFPPTVLQHDGSIWKCLLKGSGVLLKSTGLLLNSKHWHIYTHADVQMDGSFHEALI